MSEDVDAVIIGAGVIGASIALELSRRGYRTVNVDRLPAAGYGPTSNSCAIVRAHYSSLEGVKMAYEGFSYWQDWRGYLDLPPRVELARYVNCGTVLLKSPTGHHEKFVGHYRRIGVEFEEWEIETLRARMPYIDTASFWPPSRPSDPDFFEARGTLSGAIFTPGSGYVSDPALATKNLQWAAEKAGARFLFRREVTAIAVKGDRVVGVELDDRTRIHARVVVNVAGPHSFLINRMAGVEETMRVKTRALRHEVHQVPAPPGVDFERNGFHVSDADSATYFRPDVGNRLLIGSEDPPCDPKTWVENPDEFDRGVTQEQWEAQVFRCARRIPSLRVPHTMTGFADLYDVSDDWLPIYDRSDLSGFYMAIGTSGNQFKNAAVVGHLMAELIDMCEQGHEHDRQPIEVRARYTGFTLEAGFYSRLREVNPNSTYSVIG